MRHLAQRRSRGLAPYSLFPLLVIIGWHLEAAEEQRSSCRVLYILVA